MIPQTQKPEINIELTPRQAEVLNSNCTEILYGGAAGGGKSFLARCLAILWCLEIPGLNVFLFRRIYADLDLNHLQGPNGFRALLSPWCNTKHPKSPLIGGVLCDIVDGEIRFWNGSRIFLCHLQHQKDLTKYYGPEFHVLMIEEATQFTEYMIRFLRSRLRMPKTLKIPDKYKKPQAEWRSPTEPEYYFPRVLLTSNPGGVGHAYVKKSFISCAPEGVPHKAPDDDGGATRVYIPAKVDDNPHINREAYKATLAGLPPQLVDALLNGNWDAVMGAFFQEIDRSVHVVKSFQIPPHWVRLMAMDWGACGDGDPFSIGWAAVSDGSFPQYPRGSLIVYRRWTGHGMQKVTATQVAEGILYRERHDGQISTRVAGGDIMEKRGHGPSIFEIFATAGVHFQRADMRRDSGWMQMRERFVGKNGVPAIFWFEEAAGDLETIGNLQHDLNDQNDAAPGDDHCLHGDTLIKTDKGNVPIRDLVGTTGHVYDQRGKLTPYWNCKNYGIDELIRLTFSDGSTIECTPDHRLMDWNGAWVKAEDGQNMALLGVGGKLGPSCVKIEKLPPSEVFCLDTNYPHAFQTASGIVVHNCADKIRYLCMARPWVRDAAKPVPPIESQFRAPTINEAWAELERQGRVRR